MTCYIIHGKALTKSSVSLVTSQHVWQNKPLFASISEYNSFFPRILKDGSYCLYVLLVWLWHTCDEEKAKKEKIASLGNSNLISFSEESAHMSTGMY